MDNHLYGEIGAIQIFHESHVNSVKTRFLHNECRNQLNLNDRSSFAEEDRGGPPLT